MYKRITFCAVMLALTLLSIPAAMSLTRTISDSHDDMASFIVNSNGNYWEATSSNIQAAIDDLHPQIPINGGYGGTLGFVWLPSGRNFTTDSTLVIGRSVILDMQGSTIIPSGNFDVIKMRDSSQLRNGVINVSSVGNFDKSAITFNATDGFSIKEHLSMVKNMELVSGGLRGKGIYLNTEGSADQCIIATFRDIKTREFEYGILINHTGTGDAFINGNIFSNIEGYGDKYFITFYEEQQEVTGNYFQNVRCYCTNNTEYVVWNNGQANSFDNIVAYNWDSNGGTRASYNFSTTGIGNSGGNQLFISLRGGGEDLSVGSWAKWSNSYSILDLGNSSLKAGKVYQEG